MIDPNVLALVKAAGLQFFVQENDVVQLAIDKQKLSGRPYMQPFEVSLSASSYNTDGQEYIEAEYNGTVQSKQQFMIPEGELWVLSKITHRDIEAGIFTVEFRIDGEQILPPVTMESSYFLLEFPKSVFCVKHFITRVYNNETTTRTYRHIRHWQRYNKDLVNAFLAEYGVDPIK